MNKIRKTYMPAIAITFMYVVLFSTVMNMINGDTGGYHGFTIQLFGYLVLAEVVDYLLSRIDIRSYLIYYITEFSILYLMFLIISYCFSWFQFNMINLAVMTAAFLVIFALVSYHFYKVNEQEAQDINRLLNKKREHQ